MALLGLVLPGCSGGCRGNRAQTGRAQVVVTIFPVFDLVRRIAGPDADVSLLVPPGQSVHGFQPRMDIAEDVSRVRLGVMVGLGLDDWMEAVMRRAPERARVLKLGDRVPQLTKTADSDSAPSDPHVWLDPQRAQLMVRAVTEELGRVDPAHVLAYRERSKSLDASLVALDREAEARLAKLPKRGLLTHHAAFAYFAERFGMTVLDAVVREPPNPPSEAHLATLRTAIQQKRVGAIFREPQLDPAPVEALAKATGLSLGLLDPLGGGPESGSYEALIRFNVAALESQLH
jgi:zinc transport system substrate-binding protein